MSKKGPEALTQKLILDWLAANRIWHERRNTGAVVQSYGGKTRMTRFSRPGTADIMWTHQSYSTAEQMIGWIEVKSTSGKQSEAQKTFQQDVENAGHYYIVARSLDDVTDFFK